MATSLKQFKASELAAVLGESLGRGRPSLEMRARLEADVQALQQAGIVKIKGGKLVQS